MSSASPISKFGLSDIKRIQAVPAVLYGSFSHSAHSKCLISSHTYFSLPLALQSRISAEGTLLLALEFKNIYIMKFICMQSAYEHHPFLTKGRNTSTLSPSTCTTKAVLLLFSPLMIDHGNSCVRMDKRERIERKKWNIPYCQEYFQYE